MRLGADFVDEGGALSADFVDEGGALLLLLLMRVAPMLLVVCWVAVEWGAVGEAAVDKGLM